LDIAFGGIAFHIIFMHAAAWNCPIPLFLQVCILCAVKKCVYDGTDFRNKRFIKSWQIVCYLHTSVPVELPIPLLLNS